MGLLQKAYKATRMGDVDHAGNWSQRRSAVQSKMSSGNYKGALIDSLENPPFNCKDPQLVAESAQLVAQCCAQIKGAEAGKVAADLNPTQQDTLMKYVYKAMAAGENCA